MDLPFDPPGHDLTYALGQAKRRMTLLTAAVALMAWIAGTLVFMAVFVFADHWWPGGWPDQARVFAVNTYLAASAVWLCGAGFWLLIRRLNDIYAARVIERANPEMGNTLVDALQLGRRGDLAGSIRQAILVKA